MELSNFLVVTANRSEPSLAIAACRAGAVGVLDLENASDTEALLAIERLSRFTTTGFGVKLGPGNSSLVERLARRMPDRLGTVLLATGDVPGTLPWVDSLRSANVRILLECTTLGECIQGQELGVDGLILKGHEAGGRVGQETSLILVQRWCQQQEKSQDARLPFWVQGGIGRNTSAACAIAGATGVVLDSQVLLARESHVSAATREWLASCDGSETVCLGERLGQAYRLVSRPGSRALTILVQTEQQIFGSSLSAEERLREWREAVRQQVVSSQEPLLLGQDLALARSLAEQHVTVAGILQALDHQARANLAAAEQFALDEHALLSKRHGTKYPLVQGPMTRVSDTAPFANAVAQAGALPFLALALLRRAETEKLLDETKRLLADRPWGVGILGFLPPEIRKEQIEAILAYRPPFALIAGGRPDQARELEKEGIPTYLHVPSPGLLRMFLRDGARRFVFEGRECGGHVGPRSSFVLWETMCEILLAHINQGGKADELQVVFAGGIHDGLSGAMVAALSAELAQRGVAIGLLMGTAYLYTREATAAGAIVPRFQQEALECRETVLMETGPGHAIRCIKTPYYDDFEREKTRLQQEGRSHEEIIKTLEWMNIGRLRAASKGLDRPSKADQGAKLVQLDEEEQYARGMYMIGQVSALRHGVTSMAELHDEVCRGATERLMQREAQLERVEHAPPPCDVAIIGMSCFYPAANDPRTYWENILNKQYAVTEIPDSHWDWRLYFDPNPRARDKIYSKWGGFLSDIPFDPLSYGITPNSLHSIEPLQLFLLEAVRHALMDAGYANRPFDRERVATILGIGGGGSPLAVAYGFRTCLPLLDSVPDLPAKSSEILKSSEHLLPEWTEDSFPGILLNVAVGRVANRFNFGGPNYAIDAACASSLAALQACVRELELGTSDVAVAMGADTVQTPYAYMAFSKTHALSQRGRCSPFDASADGIVLSEGIGVVVLKRLADAERDGDRIYGVIKGMGASSDGKDKGLTCPNSAGQMRALRRAYAQARVSPLSVSLIEAHGTGTVVGDQTEAQSLAQILSEAGAPVQSCALGSVKSMIGHAKCAAGLAGLIKTTLALHHKTLPPTLVEQPNPRAAFDKSPLYLNTEARPWVHGGLGPRTAGVSAFGFGGTNFHVVLEEYAGNYRDESEAAWNHWPAEILVWRRARREEVIESLQQIETALERGAQPELAPLAKAVCQACSADTSLPTLAIVATSIADLREKMRQAVEALRAAPATLADPRGIYYAAQPARGDAGLVMLFPGQGSQYPNMLAQVAMAFPRVRQALDRAERTLAGHLEQPLGRYIYPASSFTPEQEKTARQDLARTDVAQPAVGAASLGMHGLLVDLGLRADFLAGHSYGEYVALHAANAIGEEDLLRLSHERGRILAEATRDCPGGMAAVDADAGSVERCLTGLGDVVLANINSPRQTVIAGTEAGLSRAIEHLQQQGLRAARIPVSCAFHSPWIAPARRALENALAACTFTQGEKVVYSNTTAAAYPDDARQIAPRLAEHLVSPVRFQEQIEALHAAGARVFVEVGPHAVLTGLVGQILDGRDHLAISTDLKGRPGLPHLAHGLAQLAVNGVSLRLSAWFEGRDLRVLDLDQLERQCAPVVHSASTWMVNSVRSRPIHAPEPQLLGQTRHIEPRAAEPPQTEHAPPPLAAPSLTPSSPRIQEPPRVSVNPSPVPHAPPPTTGYASFVETSQNGNGAHDHAEHAPLHQAPPYQAADEASQVMLRFQDLMSHFLDTQRSVMLSYLQGSAQEPLSPALFDRQLPAATTNGHAPHVNGAAPHAADFRGLAQAAEVMPAAETGQAVPQIEPARTGETSTPERAATPQTTRLDRASLSAELLGLVSKRTGYPKEMLGLDLDLEGDLGVDSIKRVEILGTLAESIGASADGLETNLELEKLTSIKTLRGILDYLESALSGASAGSQTTSTPTASAPGTAQQTRLNSNGREPHAAASMMPVQRALIRLVDAPLPSGGSTMIPSGTVLVTDDGRGVAQELAGRLADFGQRVVLVRHAPGGSQTNGNEDVHYCDLTDARAVDHLVESLRKQGEPLAGLFHLLPLAEMSPAEDWGARTRRDLVSLYMLSRALEQDLRKTGGEGQALLMAATGLGGRLGFGTEPLPETFYPGHGAVLGFVKCLGMEWPEVLVRAVDLDSSRSPSYLAERLLGELSDPDGPLEVGHALTGRVTWEPVSAPLTGGTNGSPLLEPGATVLITGGARGITATVGAELARRYQPNLILVGRTPLPAEEESSETRDLKGPAEIKSALIARYEREGRQASPAAIESDFQRLLRDREIRANLARIRQAGSRVEYAQVDVRDEQAMAALLDDIQKRHGGIDGVIHGAGVIEDKLIRDKTPESLERVLGTKLDSALILSRLLDPKRLKFCVFFSSIASRYGNRGQADYAAANEVLSKLALYLDRVWPGRVVSIDWGPWSSVGMVSELEKHLTARGIMLISPETGPAFVLDELNYGHKGESEVIIAGGTEHAIRPKRSRQSAEAQVASAAGVAD